MKKYLTVHTVKHLKNHVYLSLSQTFTNANLYGLETLLFFVHIFVNVCSCITGRQIVNTICFYIKRCHMQERLVQETSDWFLTDDFLPEM